MNKLFSSQEATYTLGYLPKVKGIVSDQKNFKVKHFPAILIQITSLSNLIKLFQLICENKVMELEHHHFDTFNELMDLSFGQQWLLASKVYSQHHYNLMNIVNEHSIANFLAKGNESEFIKPLDPAVNL